jgi:peptidoglycan/xylan/chitin deacetylase (PgdA/CDA1 family)
MASLSLDLDNKWSYMKTHGDLGWESFPSYLDILVPRVLDFLRERDLTITFFVVGQDASLKKNSEALRAIALAGHEIGNHSFHHEPWLHLYTRSEIVSEFSRAEEAILAATGQRPLGFRGPGFSLSLMTLEELEQRGYLYDASTFPTFLGPLARTYYFWRSRLTPEEKARRRELFGTFKEGFRPLRPYRWRVGSGGLIEIPVTTMPLLRTPIHLSYLLYLGTRAPRLASAYFDLATRLCRATGTGLSFLLHPLDFLGREDAPELAFFPAMNQPSAGKIDLADKVFSALTRRFQVVTMKAHALDVAGRDEVRCVEPRFRESFASRSQPKIEATQHG